LGNRGRHRKAVLASAKGAAENGVKRDDELSACGTVRATEKRVVATVDGLVAALQNSTISRENCQSVGDFAVALVQLLPI
jgi:hypothetical protein